MTPWYRSQPLTPELKEKVVELTAEQERLKARITLQPLTQPMSTIAGCDSAFIGKHILSVFVVFSFPELEEIELQYHLSQVELPYIPGFLAFREIPNLLLTYQKLHHIPDVIMVDGHGILHPRRMGIATHLGVTLDRPTFGVAKKKLYGKYEEPDLIKGSITPIFDQKKEEILGTVIRSKDNIKPLFVSPGHLCSIEDARDLTLHTLRKHKLPEPTRKADFYSKSLKEKFPEFYTNEMG